MRIYKPTYKDKDGKIKKVRKWWVELRDHNEIVRRFAGYPGNAKAHDLTEAMGEQIERLINFENTSGPPDKKSNLWIEQMPAKLRSRLVDIGLLDAVKTEAKVKPLVEYLADFQTSISVKAKKDFSGKQAKQTAKRVKRIIEGCNFKKWDDISGGSIDLYIYGLRKEGMKPRAACFYVKAFRRFIKWMLQNGCKDNTVEIEGIAVPFVPERAFEKGEYNQLLKATRQGPERYGLSGHQRYLLYCLAVETGLRRNELQSLTPVSFDLKNRKVFVKGGDPKDAAIANQTISPELTPMIQEYVKCKMPNVQLFKIHDKSSKMIQADCEAAGVKVVNVKGKIKFHSLRHTCATFLIAAGVNMKVVQVIMRHKDISTTINLYAHLLDGEEESAIAKLGPLCVQKAATGTD